MTLEEMKKNLEEAGYKVEKIKTKEELNPSTRATQMTKALRARIVDYQRKQRKMLQSEYHISGQWPFRTRDQATAFAEHSINDWYRGRLISICGYARVSDIPMEDWPEIEERIWKMTKEFIDEKTEELIAAKIVEGL